MSVRRRRSAHPPMTKVAMPLDKLDVWLQGRTGAAATNLSMLDGFVTAIVAGPVSMDPPEWICPLLGIGIDAFNHGGTPEFAAISAVAVRHNAIVETRVSVEPLPAAPVVDEGEIKRAAQWMISQAQLSYGALVSWHCSFWRWVRRSMALASKKPLRFLRSWPYGLVLSYL
jgi:uncharacterized protein UPF0149